MPIKNTSRKSQEKQHRKLQDDYDALRDAAFESAMVVNGVTEDTFYMSYHKKEDTAKIVNEQRKKDLAKTFSVLRYETENVAMGNEEYYDSEQNLNDVHAATIAWGMTWRQWIDTFILPQDEFIVAHTINKAQREKKSTDEAWTLLNTILSPINGDLIFTANAVAVFAETYANAYINTQNFMIFDGAKFVYVAYNAVLDSRTTVGCRNLNGNYWPASSPNIVYPGYHPHCRSWLEYVEGVPEKSKNLGGINFKARAKKDSDWKNLTPIKRGAQFYKTVTKWGKGEEK